MSDQLPALSDKERSFLEVYLDPASETFLNAKQAMLLLEPDVSPNAAAARGSRATKRLAGHIAQWLEEEGLGDNTLRGKLVRLLDSPSEQTQLKALEMAMKVRGMYKDSAIDNSITVNIINYADQRDPLAL